jgi:hypothetical protein
MMFFLRQPRHLSDDLRPGAIARSRFPSLCPFHAFHPMENAA